jgi:hypothetical protein
VNINELRDILEARTGGTRSHENRVGFDAHCPAHQDRNRSLSVDPGEKGIVLKCFAGCSFDDIFTALGLRPEAFFADDGKHRASYPRHLDATLQPSPAKADASGQTAVAQPKQPRATAQHRQEASEGCTLAAYAEAKRLPIGFLKMQGLSEFTYQSTAAVRIPYRDTAGIDRSVRFRIELHKRSDGSDNRFRWKSGSKTMVYGLWRLGSERVQQSAITLVEGESDCHTLWFHGISALGIPGADTWNEERDAPYLERFDTVYVVLEPDRGGQAVKKWLAKSRIRYRVRLVCLGEHKDPSGLYLADPEHFERRWQEALDASTPWTDVETAERQQQASSAWKACAALAKEPDILARFAKVLASAGVAGEERTVKLLYLAITSRFLARPVSLALKGPSSAGKSYTTERVLNFFPPSAFYSLSAMSERALAYSDEPLQHRMLVIYEAAGLHSDFASYLLRSLLSEGCVRYETVERTPEGLRPRLIEREGPTGLLVTTTAVRLHPENETRMLSVPVTDTKEQTKAVLRAQAKESQPNVDMKHWHALQSWLEGAEHRVTIPYAEQLAEAIPPVALRLRRDFPLMLNLIRAHALLHQAMRVKDSVGRIVATLADYAAIRALVNDLVADALEATVPATIRETVEAVEKLRTVNGAKAITVAEVATKLKLDKSAAWRRVQVAIKRGYLWNLEERKGHQAQLVIGLSMPADVAVLPEAHVLADDCGVAEGCNPAATTPIWNNSAPDRRGCGVASDVAEDIPPPLTGPVCPATGRGHKCANPRNARYQRLCEECHEAEDAQVLA